MKKWNEPTIETLEISETANGFFCASKEFCILTHAHHGCEDNKKEETPDSDPVEHLS